MSRYKRKFSEAQVQVVKVTTPDRAPLIKLYSVIEAIRLAALTLKSIRAV